MIKFENTVYPSPEQMVAVIRGMRNPKNSWEVSDTMENTCSDYSACHECPGVFDVSICNSMSKGVVIGPNDKKLMINLAKGGPVHAKYRRMMTVMVDITAPLYWWKEFDTYKVGTVANSCSTMHKIAAKPFELDDFSVEHLSFNPDELGVYIEHHGTKLAPGDIMKLNIEMLNAARDQYLEVLRNGGSPCVAKDIWWQMIQLLGSNYNQKRTVMMSYEVLHNIYFSRKDHKQDEWRVDFMNWIHELPYSELITEPEEKYIEKNPWLEATDDSLKSLPLETDYLFEYYDPIIKKTKHIVASKHTHLNTEEWFGSGGITDRIDARNLKKYKNI